MTSAEERFWAKVEKTETCWNWTASLVRGGYGQFFPRRGMNRYAHRVSYELTRGSIPQGLQLDHLCRNRKCVNPDHLEPVTRRENLIRGNGAAGLNSRKTECDWGHSFGEFGRKNSQGIRECTKCRQRRDVERAHRLGPNVTHGKGSTYKRGCRCDPCREWSRIRESGRVRASRAKGAS